MTRKQIELYGSVGDKALLLERLTFHACDYCAQDGVETNGQYPVHGGNGTTWLCAGHILHVHRLLRLAS
jgi:hypothetical protein